LAAATGVLLLGLAAGGGLPALGNGFEGEGSQLNVTPSDNLPLSTSVFVNGQGFTFATDVPVDTVTLLQCAPSYESCGPTATPLPLTQGTFNGFMVVVRMLTLSSGTTVDCLQTACEVQANGAGFAAHHLSFADPQSTSVPRATIPPLIDTTSVPVVTSTPPTTVRSVASTTPPTSATTPTTRPGSPTTLKAAPGVTIPPTTKAPATTSSSVRPSTTSSTVAPPPSTTVPPAHQDAPPTLVAVTPKNESSGPPGGGLRVTGGGYDCPTVYFFFEGTRVGSASPDATGHVSKGGLSVPGDAGKGPHEVTASCEASGQSVVQSSKFDVLPVSVHRPAFVTSLPLPSQVSLDPGVVLASAAVALGAIALIAFPYELFNSTMEENYHEIRGWFGKGPRSVPEPKTRGNVLSFLGLTAVTAVACGFLSPGFGLNPTSAVQFVGIFVALLVMAVVFSLPADIGIRRQFGEWGKLNFLPGSVIVTIVMVVACRLFNFQPGFFYGALAGLAYRSALSEPVQGKMTAANWVFSLIISVGAFFMRVPVSAASSRPGSSIWWIGLEICLSLIFLWGVEGLAVAMLPLRFLDGRKVYRWSKTAWAVMFFLGIFATFHVLLRPGSGYVGSTSGAVGVGVMTLFAAFGLGSVAFWAYFRFRPDRWVPAPTRA
jgi:hypothetical protein